VEKASGIRQQQKQASGIGQVEHEKWNRKSGFGKWNRGRGIGEVK
jgi:hypothetical protein